MTASLTQRNTINSDLKYQSTWNTYVDTWDIKVCAGSAVLPAKKDIIIPQGGNFLVRVNIRDSNNALFDLSNWRVYFNIKEDYSSAASLLTATEGAVYSGSGYANRNRIKNYGSTYGFFDLFLGADETEELDFDSGVWDLKLVLVTATSYGFTGNYNSLAIDVDYGTNQSRITGNHADAAYASRGIAVADIIRLGAADLTGTEGYGSHNNGTYPVAAVDATTITFNGLIGYGLGADDSANINATLQELTENDQYQVRLAGGRCTLQRQATA